MFFLVVLGISVVFVYSLYGIVMIFLGDISFIMVFYYELVGVILILIILGKYFEVVLKGKILDVIKKLMGLVLKIVYILCDGVEIEVLVDVV